MAKELLYEIKIKGLDEEISSLKVLQDEIKRLRAEVKQLETTGSEEAEKRKLELTEAQNQYRKLQKEVQNRNKAEQESVNTLEKMRAKLVAMNQQLERTEIGSEKFKQLTEQSKRLRHEINEADQATGKFYGNVGNYKGAIVDAFQVMGLNVRDFVMNLEEINLMFEGLSKGVGKTSGVFKIFKIALASTGIGALVVALGAVITYFTTVQEGLDKINRLLIPLGTVLRRIVGVVQDLGAGFVKLFSGDIQGAWEQIKSSASGFTDELSKAWKEGQRLYDISINLRQLTLTRTVAEERLNSIIIEQREILKNVNKSEAERLKAGKKALLAAEQLKNLRLSELDAQIEQLKLQQKQKDIGIEGLTKLAELGVKRDKAEAEYRNETLRIQNDINALQKKSHDDRLKAIAEERNMEAAMHAETVNSINALLAQYDQLTNKGKEAASAMSEVFRMKDEEDIPDIPAFIESLGSLYAEEVELARETTDVIKGTYADRLNALKSALASGLITEEQAANRRKEINVMIMKDSINTLKGMATEGSKIHKTLLIFEKMMAVREAFLALQVGKGKTASMVPFPANIPLIIGFVAQMAGLITAINSLTIPEPPKFAKGVIGLQGVGTSTSDSISARLSKGESVMTAKATKVFAPVLAQMELAVGNKPNYQLGNRRFAGGFIPAQIDPMTNIDNVIERTIKSIEQIPVVVSERDITETQKRVVRIKTTGDL